MASLSQIREGLRTTIKSNVNTNLHVYNLVEDMGQLPAVIIEPVSSDFDEAMQRGMDVWDFNLFVLVSRAVSSAHGQTLLDQLISGAGVNSIREILYQHSDLGLSDGTDAHVYQVKAYGGSFDWAKVAHVGAVIKVMVRTPGSA